VLINLGVKLFLIFAWHAHIFVVIGVLNTAKLSTWAHTTSGGERDDHLVGLPKFFFLNQQKQTCI
jgi:hypothetical protein